MHEQFADAGIIVRVQTWDSEAAAPADLERLVGATWPRHLGVAVAADALWTVICIGPTEWLVLGAALEAPNLVEEFERAFEGTAFRTTDVSQALLRLRIEDNAAVSVLGKGCSLDLDLTAFSVGGATRTRLAGIPVVVWRTGAAAFECIITRGYGEYFRAWLADATLEFHGAG